MEARLYYGDELIRLDAAMSWMVIYERAFRRDALSAIYALLGREKSDDPATLIVGALWSMARNADPSIEAADTWFMDHKDIDLAEVVPELQKLVALSLETIEDPPARGDGGGVEKQTLNTIIAGGLMRGLTLADTKRLTFGQWLDIVFAYDRLSVGADGGGQNGPRKATAADIEWLKYG